MWYEIPLDLVGLLFTVVLVAGIITGFRRKRSECPMCGKKTFPKKTLVVDQTSGEEVEGERDFEYALATAMIGVVVGAFFVVGGFSNLGLRNFGPLDTILYVSLFALPGLLIIRYGVERIRRAIHRINVTRGKPMTCYFECSSCKHTWTEAATARA
jgi:hypothetical protein